LARCEAGQAADTAKVSPRCQAQAMLRLGEGAWGTGVVSVGME